MASVAELEAAVSRFESAIVAFSGGVDSSVVAAIVIVSISPPIIHLVRERARSKPTLTRA